MQVEFAGGEMTPAQRLTFEQAAKRWSDVVVGDLQAEAVESRHVEQYCNGYSYSGPIDDLLLLAAEQALDGPGGVVGMAGACIVRSDSFPLVGVVVIDSDDIDDLEGSGDLYNVVLHELGHVLDLSHSGWKRRGLLHHDRDQCMESRTVQFTGEAALAEYSRLGGNGNVPVEDNAIPGTACSHWDHETFHSELMTGYLSRDAKLSRLTVAALADMGYRVDLEAADDYTLHADWVRPQSISHPVQELLLPPPAVLGDDGEIIHDHSEGDYR